MQVDTACVARRLFVFLKAQEVHWQNQKIPIVFCVGILGENAMADFSNRYVKMLE